MQNVAKPHARQFGSLPLITPQSYLPLLNVSWFSLFCLLLKKKKLHKSKDIPLFILTCFSQARIGNLSFTFVGLTVTSWSMTK